MSTHRLKGDCFVAALKALLLAMTYLLLLTACTATEVPVVEQTSTPVPTSIPSTAAPTSTIEAIIPTVTPTQEFTNQRRAPCAE